MFTRPEENYEIENAVIDGILTDCAQPLFQIVKMLPDASTVLDIGAGGGTLGQVLKRAKKNVTIDGIEPNAFAANLAKPFYRNMHIGFAQEFFTEINANKYDYIVLADVIEHIPNPMIFLTELLKNVQLSTNIVISVPNIAFGGVRLALLNGQFEYVDSGLLERTHLRFFTLDTAKKLFKLLNLVPIHIFSLERSFYRTEFSRSSLKASPLQIFKLAINSDARAYQYLFLLSRKPNLEVKIEHQGVKAIQILIDALIAWPKIKQITRQWRKK
jgi:2-polyprenyl-3-methyl-5-hydroxy-6-metoxy-1,4-benzoquinol methylase